MSTKNMKIDYIKYPNAIEYRRNVGLIITNKDGLFFAGKRIDTPEDEEKSWQMPQGGIDNNETEEDACLRELFEETGITDDKVKVIKKMPNLIRYDFLEHTLKANIGTKYEKYRGQEQRWFLLSFLGKDEDINLKPLTSEPPEFSTWKWSSSDFLIQHCIDFKIETYKQVFDWVKEKNKC